MLEVTSVLDEHIATMCRVDEEVSYWQKKPAS
jgi:hypothetical protein